MSRTAGAPKQTFTIEYTGRISRSAFSPSRRPQSGRPRIRRSMDRSVQRWQHWLTPQWKHVAGGCHLDRDMGGLIAKGGFRIERLDTGYMRGARPMTFIY